MRFWFSVACACVVWLGGQNVAEAQGGLRWGLGLEEGVPTAEPEGLSPDFGFVEAQLGLWLPAPGTFNFNHTVSVQGALEAGVRVLRVGLHHQLYGVGGLVLSPQTLEAHAGGHASTIVVPWLGLRYVNSSLCTRDRAGCPFVELGFGLTFEATKDDPQVGHHPPSGTWTVLAAVGYRHRVSDAFHVGARIDFAYLEESFSRELGWITPSAFAGFTLH